VLVCEGTRILMPGRAALWSPDAPLRMIVDPNERSDERRTEYTLVPMRGCFRQRLTPGQRRLASTETTANG
jgi:hypothetical protein